jgi:hypothetical protein
LPSPIVAIVCTLKKKASANEPGRAFSMLSGPRRWPSAKSALAAAKTSVRSRSGGARARRARDDEVAEKAAAVGKHGRAS